MTEFALNDPVFVNRDGGDKLEGVVTFLGTVDFAEGDDWVGVRVTGSSAGKGKNDGSVQGHSYFKCPANNGLFVRKGALELRKLSKIEELRLRRELAASGIPSASTTSTAASSTSPTATNRGSSTAASEASTPARQSRLEELRLRRASIATDRDDTSDLNEKLRAKDGELASIKETLASVEQQLASTKESLKTLQTENETLQEKVKAQKMPVVISKRTDEDDETPEPDTWIREKKILEDQLTLFEEKVKTLTKEMEKQKSEQSTETTQLRSEALAYKNELQALTEQSKQRGVSDTSHYKEKAVLQAQMAALRREVQDLKNEKIEMESTLEDLALDKEQLQEENEGLHEKLEEIKIDAETAQMEVEELRTELEESRAVAERAGSSLEMSNAVLATTGDDAQSDDMAQALSIQNARLREALIRLREQSSVEKMELSRQLKASEKEAESAKGQVKQGVDLESQKSKLEEEIRDLKDMVDQGAAFEGMVEDLSDKLMELEERNLSLIATIR
jgi:dynactin 1